MYYFHNLSSLIYNQDIQNWVEDKLRKKKNICKYNKILNVVEI